MVKKATSSKTAAKKNAKSSGTKSAKTTKAKTATSAKAKTTKSAKTTAKKTSPKKKKVSKSQDEFAETAKTDYPKLVDTRLSQILFTLEDNKCESVYVSYLPNIRYLTGFSGSAAHLFILKDRIVFVTDDRYEEQIKTDLYPLPNLETYITRDVWQFISDTKLFEGLKTMAFEADRVPYSEAVNIRNMLRPIKFKPIPNIVEPFTTAKAEEEFEDIKASARIAVKTYEKILDMIKPGMTEREIAIEIAYITRQLGSEGDPFPIIAVSGKRGALIHGKPSDKPIKNGDIVTLDFGCVVNGFASDITRTFAIGKATREQKKVYKILHRAKETAIENARPGVNGKILDAYARDIIKKEGYGDYFQHSLGHGLGIQVHEKPIITFRMSDQIVPENCVLAIEPGIYLPNKFGMRIEDDIRVTKSGAEKITEAPEELLIV